MNIRYRFRTAQAVVLVTTALTTPWCHAAAGTQVTTLVSFDGTNGFEPGYGGVTDSVGNFFGTSDGAGINNEGALYEVRAADHSLKTLVNFNQSSGYGPLGGVTLNLNGNLFGTTANSGPAGGGTIYEYSLGTQSFTNLASFNGTNGSDSYSGLVADSRGDLFGTTRYGGASGLGTVFELAVGSTTITTLASLNTSTGSHPVAGVAIDKSGNLYGAGYDGGSNNYGTLFEVSGSTHKLTVIDNFNNSLGYYPSLTPALDPSGNLYLATTNSILEFPAGSSTPQILNNTFFPVGVNTDTSGDLFVATTNDVYNKYGSIIEFPVKNHLPVVLGSFQFADSTNGSSALAFDAAGDLYGTRFLGGSSGKGEVFEFPAASIPEPASLILSLPAIVLLLRRKQMSRCPALSQRI